MHPTAAIFRSSVDALETLNMDAVVDYFADDAEVVIKATSMGIPTLGKQGFHKMMKEGFLSVWFKPGQLKFVFDEVYEIKTPENAVVVLAHSDGTTDNGTVWHNEYMYIVEADASGTKIKKLTEFTDSGFVRSFMAEEAKNAGGA